MASHCSTVSETGQFFFVKREHEAVVVGNGDFEERIEAAGKIRLPLASDAKENGRIRRGRVEKHIEADSVLREIARPVVRRFVRFTAPVSLRTVISAKHMRYPAAELCHYHSPPLSSTSA